MNGLYRQNEENEFSLFALQEDIAVMEGRITENQLARDDAGISVRAESEGKHAWAQVSSSGGVGTATCLIRVDA